MRVKLLTEHHLGFLSLKGSCTDSYESTLVKIPHCWKSHVTAHLEQFYHTCYRGIVALKKVGSFLFPDIRVFLPKGYLKWLFQYFLFIH